MIAYFLTNENIFHESGQTINGIIINNIMEKFFDWLTLNPVAILFVAVLVILFLLIFFIAFLQGREIAFWPPKIGPLERRKKYTSNTSNEEHLTQIDVYEAGRMKIHEKVTFFKDAQKEVIELGIALSTFSSFFVQRPEHEYKKPVIDLLRKGVNFKCLVLNSDSAIAKIYGSESGEVKLKSKIDDSLELLKLLQSEFKKVGLKGNFDIYKYTKTPFCYVLLVDPSDTSGRAYISNYIHGIKRADAPIFEIHKKDNPIIFEKYYSMVRQIIDQSEIIN